MTQPNQTPNLDPYQLEQKVHLEVIEVIHGIGQRSLSQLVELKQNIISQGNSPELADLLIDKPETGTVYI